MKKKIEFLENNKNFKKSNNLNNLEKSVNKTIDDKFDILLCEIQKLKKSSKNNSDEEMIVSDSDKSDFEKKKINVFKEIYKEDI